MTTGRVKEMADFVVHVGFTPDAYWNLTPPERDAIVEAFNRKARGR